MIVTDTGTKLTGILGNPVAHSLSPKMHSYLAEKTGVNTAYLAFCIEREDLESVLSGALRAGVQGFNVTSPFKTEVLPFMDVLDPEAEWIGSVNTVVNLEGKWHGSNTDGDGFIASLLRRGVSVSGKHVLLIGSGGTARTMTYKFAQKGAASVTVSSRRIETARQLAPLIKDFPGTAFYDCYTPERAYDIVVNCTPFGMEPYEDKNPMPKGLVVRQDMVFCDLIYNPPKTLFLQEAQRGGAIVINGLDMLLYQGVLAFERFFDLTVSEAVVDGLFTLFEQEA
ncbi:MAG: shikimate dehydrogenase [Ruminococcaceae bacterium]|nr:shikimate dehydrogenase [Oscillospiraceae bacterium]